MSHTVYIDAKYPDPRKAEEIPMSATANLRTAAPNPLNPSLLPDTGTLRFIADRARPDILVAVGELSTGGAESLSDLHMTTSERIKNYLVTTKDLYVKLGGLGAIKIFGYSDAAYITDGNAKSRLGGCAFMGLDAGAVLSFSRNDSIMSSLSHSSTEAEIKAVDELMREMIHLLDVSRFCAVSRNSQ